MNQAPLSPEHFTKFALAGNAIFTVVSKKTGTRFTYRVRIKENQGRPPIWFVSVLTGSDNTSDYTYIGQIVFNGKVFAHGFKSTISYDAPSVKAFEWVWKVEGNHEALEVWHVGKCGKCSRPLTTPESVKSGIGPICATKGA
jgi:hypothetical protein